MNTYREPETIDELRHALAIERSNCMALRDAHKSISVHMTILCRLVALATKILKYGWATAKFAGQTYVATAALHYPLELLFPSKENLALAVPFGIVVTFIHYCWAADKAYRDSVTNSQHLTSSHRAIG